MPAPFALDLCGNRTNGKPNTSDASDAFSVELGQVMFEAMGVSPDAVAPESIDKPMSTAMAADLQARLTAAGRDLVVKPERPLNAFAQYRHVGVMRGFSVETSPEMAKAVQRLRKFILSKVTTPKATVDRRDTLLADLDKALAGDAERRKQIVDDLGEESLLNLDVTAYREQVTGLPTLEAGFSLKWTLRTDRAQDCRSQGAKMSSLRRGRMPHFAAVTMEPRPYMLRLLGGGSGEVDCVYHLDLPSLTVAIEATTRGNPKRRETAETFRRLVDQRRLRDYSELVDYILTL